MASVLHTDQGNGHHTMHANGSEWVRCFSQEAALQWEKQLEGGGGGLNKWSGEGEGGRNKTNEGTHSCSALLVSAQRFLSSVCSGGSACRRACFIVRQLPLRASSLPLLDAGVLSARGRSPIRSSASAVHKEKNIGLCVRMWMRTDYDDCFRKDLRKGEDLPVKQHLFGGLFVSRSSWMTRSPFDCHDVSPYHLLHCTSITWGCLALAVLPQWTRVGGACPG